MTDKSKRNIEELETLKSRTISKLYGIDEKDTKLTQEINYEKMFKIITKFFILLSFATLVGTTLYFSNEYRKFQKYRSDIKNELKLADKYKKYLKEEEIKKEEKIEKEKAQILEKEKALQELKELNLDTISKLPDSKKIVMLNILPSGKPLKKTFRVTSSFGVRIHPITNKRKMHNGIDLSLKIGDKVISTSTGIVSFAGTKQGYGHTVVIKNIYGFETIYAHLSKVLVKNGEIVGRGKVIAKGGNSGISTGPHLHYEIRYNGKPINPANFIDWDIKNFDIIFRKEKDVPWDYFLTIMGKN